MFLYGFLSALVIGFIVCCFMFWWSGRPEKKLSGYDACVDALFPAPYPYYWESWKETSSVGDETFHAKLMLVGEYVQHSDEKYSGLVYQRVNASQIAVDKPGLVANWSKNRIRELDVPNEKSEFRVKMGEVR